jgi:hypothetical protein
MIYGYDEMTSIIWYIYNEFLKKEKELLEKTRKKEHDQRDRNRDIRKDPGLSDEKK